MDTGVVPWQTLPITVWLLWIFLCIVTFWHVLDYSLWFPFHCYIPKLSGQYRSSKSKHKVLGAQSCPTLFVSVDCSSPDPPVHGISQARLLDSVAISFSTGSSWPRDQTWVFSLQVGSRLSLHIPWSPPNDCVNPNQYHMLSKLCLLCFPVDTSVWAARSRQKHCKSLWPLVLQYEVLSTYVICELYITTDLLFAWA